MLERWWGDGRRGMLAAVLLAMVVALAWAWLMPRGPITTIQALASLAMALGLGVVLGLLSGSRWSAILGPLAFAAAFEVMRVVVLGVRGPTVEAIRLDSTYGIIAFVTGRGISGLLLLAPMAIGSLWGVELAARLGRPGTRGLGILGWLVALAGSAGAILLGIAIAMPASTAPILSAEGDGLTDGIAELAEIRLGGHDQTVMIRGRSVESPVLLYLAGGPGGTDIGAMRADVALEQDFVVATWDQRGVGKSYAALDPVDTLTVERMVADTLELTDVLRERFDEERIYIAGNSWGTILGVLAVQQAPERFAAFVGSGQMVDAAETDRMFWEDTLAWAEALGDDALVEVLQRNGSPPYADLLAYEPALSHEHDWNAYAELDLGREMPAILFVPEYSLMDRVNGLRSFLDTFSALYPQIQELDLREAATSLEVPVYVVVGAHEARGRAVPAAEWFEALEAPSKEWIVFERSGHRPPFEQPGDFAELMRRVLAETGGREAPTP